MTKVKVFYQILSRVDGSRKCEAPAGQSPTPCLACGAMSSPQPPGVHPAHGARPATSILAQSPAVLPTLLTPPAALPAYTSTPPPHSPHLSPGHPKVTPGPFPRGRSHSFHSKYLSWTVTAQATGGVLGVQMTPPGPTPCQAHAPGLALKASPNQQAVGWGSC